MTDQQLATDTPAPTPDAPAAPSPAGFGKVFCARMATAAFASGAWSEPVVEPLAPLALHPAAMVLHYGQAVFEGLKAFRGDDGSVALFRPAANAARFAASARRLAMPPLDEGAFVEACRALVAAERDAVPDEPGTSLYLRPTMVATEAALGVRPADEYAFFVLASPVAAYFAGGLRPVTVWAEPSMVRAAPGGTGAAKCAGNYAASLAARARAVAEGCDEALWLDAAEHRWIEELGGMNAVFVADVDGTPTLVTPPTTDTILDGITRDSLLALAPALGLGVDVRPVSLEEAITPGAFVEALACGTAATVAPVGAIRTQDGLHPIGDGRPGPVTARVREALLDVQHGRRPDPGGWLLPVG